MLRTAIIMIWCSSWTSNDLLFLRRICEIPRTGYTTPPPDTTPSPNGRCPVGWWSWNNSTFCYQVSVSRLLSSQLTQIQLPLDASFYYTISLYSQGQIVKIF